MRVVLQRVAHARVVVEGELTGAIDRGLLMLVAFAPGDTRTELEWMDKKCRELRIFPDEEGKMNRSLEEIGGGMLLVSQFTLYGDTRKGRRPSFVGSAPPAQAEKLYREFIEICRLSGLPVGVGRFGAHMEVELLNDGPVTLILEKEARV